jgi:VanZ family protein
LARAAAPTQGRGRFLRYWLPVLAYVTVIFFVSGQPRLKPPGGVFYADKLAHLGEYGLLGLLLARAVRSTPRLASPVAGGLVAIGVGVVIGASDELFQSTVPGRDSSVLDFLADTAGLLMSQIAYFFIRR